MTPQAEILFKIINPTITDLPGGNFLHLKLIQFERILPNGNKENFAREVVERGQSVAILLYDPRHDKVLLINEYHAGRHINGDQPFALELPAGMIDKDETFAIAGLREASEETGVTAARYEIITPKAYLSSGGSSETIGILCMSFDSTKSFGLQGKVSEGEIIQPVLLSRQEFLAQCDNAGINDIRAILSANWLERNLDHIREKFLGLECSNTHTDDLQKNLNSLKPIFNTSQKINPKTDSKEL